MCVIGVEGRGNNSSQVCFTFFHIVLPLHCCRCYEGGEDGFSHEAPDPLPPPQGGHKGGQSGAKQKVFGTDAQARGAGGCGGVGLYNV